MDHALLFNSVKFFEKATISVFGVNCKPAKFMCFCFCMRLCSVVHFTFLTQIVVIVFHLVFIRSVICVIRLFFLVLVTVLLALIVVFLCLISSLSLFLSLLIALFRLI